MKRVTTLRILYLMIFAWGMLSVVSPSASSSLSLDAILTQVEQRYDINDFSVRFFQTATLKAMEIQETASGKLQVKRPGMMRWDYEKPDKQIIVSDGTHLWVYRPEDNQVLVGRAPSFFGEGKGAGFLSDIKSVRKNFSITLENKEGEKSYRLKLVPNNQTQDLSRVFLVVSPDTFEVMEVITYNPYDDETRIELTDYSYDRNLGDDVFRFEIPDGTDVIKMDQ
ncbi:MAG TPA: outer membrane lipoprotein carrier protein LolA [Deltaproteobacteria bacterium]|nr:outer membrane lipoprotein carrier protein LolA [Deltaproteobacteria bacterium]